MNIKSLFLGSAAAFAVVSGAQAADAIVAAAPEPMEYVKVCDAFGTGYFYIPGTETCLRVGGEVRYQVDWQDTNITNGQGNSKITALNGTLYRLHVYAKNDSEYGTVYSFIRVQGTAANNGFAMGNYVGIGGLEAGKFDTYWTRFFGYGGFTYGGGDYAFMSVPYAAYNGTAGNMSYMASIEDLQATAGKSYGVNAAVKGTFGDMGAALGVAYDGADKSTALKGYVSGKFDIVSVKLMGLWSNSATNAYTGNQKGFSTILGAGINMTDALFLGVDYSYHFTSKDWGVTSDLVWHVATGFDVRLSGTVGRAAGVNSRSAYLRLSRTF
jgi:hypothetical protein